MNVFLVTSVIALDMFNTFLSPLYFYFLKTHIMPLLSPEMLNRTNDSIYAWPVQIYNSPHQRFYHESVWYNVMFDFSFILLNFGHYQGNMLIVIYPEIPMKQNQAITYILSQIPWELHFLYTTYPYFWWRIHKVFRPSLF